jgi:hypothetical protein
MTLARSAGAQTSAALRIDLGGKELPSLKEAPIAPRLRLDDKPLALVAQRWQITPWHLMTDNAQTIADFLQTIQEAQAMLCKTGRERFPSLG